MPKRLELGSVNYYYHFTRFVSVRGSIKLAIWTDIKLPTAICYRARIYCTPPANDNISVIYMCETHT